MVTPIEPQPPFTPQIFRRKDMPRGQTVVTPSTEPNVSAETQRLADQIPGGNEITGLLTKVESIMQLFNAGLANAMAMKNGKPAPTVATGNVPEPQADGFLMTPDTPDKVYETLLGFMEKIPNPETTAISALLELIKQNKAILIAQLTQAMRG